MRIFTPLALMCATALPLTYVVHPAVAHAFDKKSKDSDKLAKAERKRAEQEAIRSAVQRGELLPLPRVLAIAQKRVPGDVVKVELDYEPTGIKYEVKILTASGRVREVEIDAKSGSVIRIEDD